MNVKELSFIHGRPDHVGRASTVPVALYPEASVAGRTVFDPIIERSMVFLEEAGITDDQCDVLGLHYANGLDYPEISAIKHENARTLHMRMYRLMLRLREKGKMEEVLDAVQALNQAKDAKTVRRGEILDLLRRAAVGETEAFEGLSPIELYHYDMISRRELLRQTISLTNFLQVHNIGIHKRGHSSLFTRFSQQVPFAIALLTKGALNNYRVYPPVIQSEREKFADVLDEVAGRDTMRRERVMHLSTQPVGLIDLSQIAEQARSIVQLRRMGIKDYIIAEIFHKSKLTISHIVSGALGQMEPEREKRKKSQDIPYDHDIALEAFRKLIFRVEAEGNSLTYRTLLSACQTGELPYSAMVYRYHFAPKSPRTWSDAYRNLVREAKQDPMWDKRRLVVLGRHLSRYYRKREEGMLEPKDEAEMDSIHAERSAVALNLLKHRALNRAPEVRVTIDMGEGEQLYAFSGNRIQVIYPDTEDSRKTRHERVFLNAMAHAGGIDSEMVIAIIGGDYAVLREPVNEWMIRTHYELEDLDKAINDAYRKRNQPRVRELHHLRATIVADRYLTPWSEGKFSRPPFRITVGLVKERRGLEDFYKVSLAGRKEAYSVELLPLSLYDSPTQQRIQELIDKGGGPAYIDRTV